MTDMQTWLIIIGAFAIYILASRNNRKDESKKTDTHSSDNSTKSNTNTKKTHTRASDNKHAIGTSFEDIVMSTIKADAVLGSCPMLRNVKIRDNSGQSAEIDIILLSNSGIYVIECKCWGGTLLANEDWNYWVQVCDGFKDCKLDKDKEKDRLISDDYVRAFESPIMQNKRHMDVLKNYLNSVTDQNLKQFKQITVLSDNSIKDHLSISRFNDKSPRPYVAPNDPSLIDGSYYTWTGTEKCVCDGIKGYPKCATSIPIEKIYTALLPYGVKVTGIP